MSNNEIHNYRLNRQIHNDIRKRLTRSLLKNYTMLDIMKGYEVEDDTQLRLLKSVFPEIYNKIEREVKDKIGV